MINKFEILVKFKVQLGKNNFPFLSMFNLLFFLLTLHIFLNVLLASEM